VPAVELIDVHRAFGPVRAVDGLDLTMRAGTVTALLGPNGAGKTTTVEMCEGFASPDRGTVRVLGLDPVADAAALRPRIGVMLQGGGGYPGAHAGEMLELIAAYADDPLDTDWLIDLLGMRDFLGTSYRRLSGGQAQRLSLACALVGRPELVFLDEPTAGMDTQSRNLVFELITALRRDGVSVLLTTHLLDEAEQLADEVFIIDRGRVLAAGTPTELAEVGTTGTVTFSTAEPLTAADLAAAGAAALTIETVGTTRHRLTGVTDPARAVADLAGWCAGRGVLITTLSTDQASLEDVFLDLTGRELRA